MDKLPKITLITPSLNQAAYLETCIRSIVEQDYPRLEYFVFDGGSTDGSVSVLEKHTADIHFWVSEKDKGQSDAIAKGIRKSTGDIVHWINSDDYLEPGALQAIADAWNPDVGCICGTSRIFSETRESVSHTDVGTDFSLFSKSRIDQPATWFSGHFMRNHLPDNDLHLAMDLDLWYRFLLENPTRNIVQIPDLLVHFREHADAKSSKLALEMLYERAQLALELRQALAGSKSENRYHSYSNLLDPKRKSQIRLGCLDFSLNAYCHLLTKKNGLAKNLGKSILANDLGFKEWLTFHRIKFSGGL